VPVRRTGAYRHKKALVIRHNPVVTVTISNLIRDVN